MRGDSRLYLCLWGCGLWLWWLGGAGPWAWCDAAKSVGSKPGTVAKAPPAASTAEAGYTGERISLELKDADLKDFFRLIGGISGLNIVLDPDVDGALTLFLKEVPWDQALGRGAGEPGPGQALERQRAQDRQTLDPGVGTAAATAAVPSQGGGRRARDPHSPAQLPPRRRN